MKSWKVCYVKFPIVFIVLDKRYIQDVIQIRNSKRNFSYLFHKHIRSKKISHFMNYLSKFPYYREAIKWSSSFVLCWARDVNRRKNNSLKNFSFHIPSASIEKIVVNSSLVLLDQQIRIAHSLYEAVKTGFQPRRFTQWINKLS